MARPRKGGERYASGDLKPKRRAWMPEPDPPRLKMQPSSYERRLARWEWMRNHGEDGWREERERYEQERLAFQQEPGYPDDIRVWRARP